MWLSIKKYAVILKALKTLADRPYLAAIEENPDGTVVFNFVQGDKIYKFITEQAEIEERIIN